MNRTNEDKLELFADLMEPVAEIVTDEDCAKLWLEKRRIKAAATAIKKHKGKVIEVLARIEGVAPEAYEIDGMKMLLKLSAMINRPDVKQIADGLFTSQDQNGDGALSGAAMENTEDGAI